jgi:hypothetical protein
MTRYLAIGLLAAALFACDGKSGSEYVLETDNTSALTATPTTAQGIAAAMVSDTASPIQADIEFQGLTDCDADSEDCNVCVKDAIGSVSQLRTHGDIMGFHMNGFPDVTAGKHWQGVQRLSGSLGKYLAVSRSTEDDTGPAFVIVKMESRNNENGSLGHRFRSNRLSPNSFFKDTPPPPEDRIVASTLMQTGFHHAGGIQLTGRILAVPFENDQESRVVFYDLTNPHAPVEGSNHVDHSNYADEAGTASIIKLASNKFMLVIGRSNANILDFYISRTYDIRTTEFDWFDTWNESELLPDPSGDSEFANYQNLNLVTGCDGVIYAVGTHNSTKSGIGEDFVDLFRLDSWGSNDVRITKIAKRHVYCTYGGSLGDSQQCNLDAAGGIYVDPEGRLFVYSTEHDNDGPQNSVKFEEFRPVPHGPCADLTDAWVELYDVDSFRDRGLMIDFRDRALENYADYDSAEGFEDKASSVRWCLPEGVKYRLWEDKNFSGSFYDLLGVGSLQGIANLGSIGWGDRVSSSEWIHGPFADAGSDQEVECGSSEGTAVQLDGTGSVGASSDSSLSHFWQAANVSFDFPFSATPIGQFPFGDTEVELTVTSGGETDTDEALISIIDSTPPVIVCPADMTLYPTSPGGATVEFGASSWSDVCDTDLPAPECPLSGSTFAKGSSTAAGCSVTDTTGGLSSDCSFVITVLSEYEMLDLLRDDLDSSLVRFLNKGQHNALQKHVLQMYDALDSGNSNRMCARLGNWINQLEGWIKAGTLEQQDAANSIEIALHLELAQACRGE